MEQKQIESLISQMTIEEKLAQMTQLAPMFFGVSQDTDLTGPLEEFHLTQEDIKNIGSLSLIHISPILYMQYRIPVSS